MAVARVQARGQVTVPEEIRADCGITPGTDLLFVVTGPGVFECRVLPPAMPLAEALRRFSAPGKAPDLKSLREEMAGELSAEHHPQAGRPRG